jgi:diguanylate cyclase (GGDEF)-like protein/PAS domain S-box-containing protein
MLVLLSVTAPAMAVCAAAIILLLRHSERRRSLDERRYALLESLQDAFVILDREWRFTHVNERAELLMRSNAADLIGKRIDHIFDPLASELFPELQRAREMGAPIEFVQSFVSTGQAIEVRIQPTPDEMLIHLRDVTERRNAEKRLQDGERRLRLLLQQVPAIVWTADLDMRLTSASGTTLSDYALVESEVIGKSVDVVFASPDGASQASAVLERVYRGESLSYETERNERWLQHDVEPLRGPDGTIQGAIGAALDITEMKHSARELARQARRDALTGLPNRLALEETLDNVMARAQATRETLAVMFLDLDRFKVINDSLGHRAGDAVLCAVADRLRITLGSRAQVFRPGGDEFILIVPGPIRSEDVQTMALEILESFTQPFEFEGRELLISASIGASLYPNNASRAEDLIKQADSAMYRAKDAGRKNAMMYNDALHARILERMGLELELRQATSRNQLRVLYQPIVDISSEQIIGAEALLRWEHPQLATIMPDRFIDIAEETGAIVGITQWVLHQACTHAAMMRAKGFGAFRIAVNISARDLCEPGFHTKVSEILAEHGLGEDALDVEVTESITLNETAVRTISALQVAGVRVVIDDFGIGYSSLEYLKRLPVGAIKIDRSFVEGVAHNPQDQAIVKAISSLATNLGFGVIAEGVETAAQRDFLATIDAPSAQGNYYSRPIPQGQFTYLLQSQHAKPSRRIASLFGSCP